MDLGEKIRTARQKAGITQSGLAEKLGLSPQRISQYESNYRRPRPELLARIAEEIGVPIAYFSDDEYLSGADAYVFLKNARKHLEETDLSADPIDLQDSGFLAYQRFKDDSYHPTKRDVRDFADASGLSVDYLLGLATEEGREFAFPDIGERFHIPGFDPVDIGIIISHIYRFLQNDLRLPSCSIADAEVIASVILICIKAENLVPLSWLFADVSSEIRNAALAVLNTGGQWMDQAREECKELNTRHEARQSGSSIRKILLADDGTEAFLVTLSPDHQEVSSAAVFPTLEKAKEYLDSKCGGSVTEK